MKAIVATSGQLGPLLKRLRKARGWSQAKLGERLGLSQERISKIEKQPEKMTVDQLLTVLMALEANIVIEANDIVISAQAFGQASSTGVAAATVTPGDKEVW